MENILERLGRVKHLKGNVYQAFSHPHINPIEEYKNLWPNYSPQNFKDYLKTNLYFDKASSRKIRNTLGKTISKDIVYGRFSTGNLNKDFIESLTNWEKAYFFIGRWAERNPDFEFPFELFVLDHLRIGIDKIKEKSIKIKREIKSLPYSKEILNLSQDNFLINRREKSKKKINENIQFSLF